MIIINAVVNFKNSLFFFYIVVLFAFYRIVTLIIFKTISLIILLLLFDCF